MKKLIVSMKSREEFFEDFKRAFKSAQEGMIVKDPHYEISFESKVRFDKFVKNISVLMVILESKPKSIYALAKILDKDVSNVKKLVKFFEEIGVVRIEEKSIDGRRCKVPIVDYQKIEFDLRAA